MTFRWWMPPVFVIGTAAVANLVLITTAVRVRPTKVAAHPYAASAHEDERRQEMADFSSRGWRLHCAVDDGGATLRLEAATGPQPASATVGLYRPDDDRLDQTMAWPDPAAALRVLLPRPGVWELRLSVNDQGGTVLTHRERVMRP
jgi:nitrogen fixation protein FixH